MGVDGMLIDVEVDAGYGMPSFDIVGLPDTAVRESKERVRTAIKNSSLKLQQEKITVNLAPADIRKDSPGLDLPIAIGLLAAHGLFPLKRIERCLFSAELSLEGECRPVRGILPMTIAAKEKGFQSIFVAKANANEALLVQGITVYAVTTLAELVAFLKGEVELAPAAPGERTKIAGGWMDDFADVQGQFAAKRALEIAAAGGHNVLMVGVPGSGKTMLARRMNSILPAMTPEEALEVTKIYSIAGLLSHEGGLVTERPFRAPHHTISRAALVGSGFHPRPGEITLAHRGVLFLDELPEMASGMVELLRQPLEERKITIGRAGGVYTYPASFLLVAAMNPCPCGYYPDRNRCTCTPREIQQYQSHVSQALLDRIDLRCEVPAASYEELTEKRGSPLSSGAMREQVLAAYRIQQERYRGTAIFFNSELQASELETYCPLTESARSLLEQVYERLGLSARGYHRILRVARTIADLEGASELDVPHISEALCFRCAEMARPDADGGARWNGKGGKA